MYTFIFLFSNRKVLLINNIYFRSNKPNTVFGLEYIFRLILIHFQTKKCLQVISNSLIFEYFTISSYSLVRHIFNIYIKITFHIFKHVKLISHHRQLCICNEQRKIYNIEIKVSLSFTFGFY